MAGGVGRLFLRSPAGEGLGRCLPNGEFSYRSCSSGSPYGSDSPPPGFWTGFRVGKAAGGAAVRSRLSFSTGRGREGSALASDKDKRKKWSLTPPDAGQSQSAECVGSMTSFALTRSVLKASRDRQLDLRLWRAFARRAQLLAPSFAAEDFSRVLVCFAAEGFRHEGLLVAASKALLPQLPDLSPSAVCRVAQVYGQLLCVDEQLLPVLKRETARKASSMTVREVAYAFASLARLGALELPVQRALCRELTVRHGDLSPGALVVALQAAAALRLRDSRLVAALSAQLCRLVRQVSGKGLALAANALVRLQVQNRFVLSLVAAAAEAQVKSLNGKDLAMLLHAAAQSEHSCYSAPCVLAIIDGVRRKACNFQVHELCVAAAALARYFSSQRMREAAAKRAMERDSQEGDFEKEEAEEEATARPPRRLSVEEVHATCEKIAERAGQVSPQLAPRHVCALVDAFSKVNFRCGPLLHHTVRHLQFSEHLCGSFQETPREAKAPSEARSELAFAPRRGYSLDELGMLARAFRRLSVNSVQVLKHAAAVLEGNEDALGGAVGTVRPTEPASRGASEEEGEMTSLPEASETSRSEALRSPLFFSLVWLLESAAADSWTDAKGLNLLCKALALRVAEAPSHGVVRVLEALRTLSLVPEKLIQSVRERMLHEFNDTEGFSQQQLRRVYAALLSLQLSPASFAVFAAPRVLLNQEVLGQLNAAVEWERRREAQAAFQRKLIERRETAQTLASLGDESLQGEEGGVAPLVFFHLPIKMQSLPGFEELKAVSEDMEKREKEARSLDFPAASSA